MNDFGKITVITPVYKSASFLGGFAANVERQTYRNFELVLVDDRSPDESGRLIDELAAKRGYIRSIHREENGGPGAARNTGLERATGDYVMFIDADDSFTDDYLGAMAQAIARDGADMAFCGTVNRIVHRAVREDIFYSAGHGFYRLLRGGEALRNFFGLFDCEVNFLGTPWAKIVRKSFYDDTSLRFPSCFHEDIIMSFKELSLARSVACYNASLYIHNSNNPASGTSTLKDRIVRQLHLVPELIGSFVDGRRPDPAGESAALRMYFYYFRTFYQFYFTVPAFAENYGSVVSSYHKALPGYDFAGNEYYVFFQLLLLYLTALRNGSPGHFAEFVAPFRDMLLSWSGRRDIRGLGDGQQALLRRFSALRADPRARAASPGIVGKFRHKVLRELYRLLCLHAASPALVRAADKALIRLSGWFDDDFYREADPAGRDRGAAPLDDFTGPGWREGRDPNAWFRVASFARTHPDIVETGANPLVYFYLTGMYRRRYF
ncbi:MAG: glycosyltransferase [Deltaproteobacteria bacterium]|jgi:glycosyltransferase involved in cell wall biosynthesis|nr:glycosyltransferase [Deltaproteobacteria bacterium]